MGNKEFIIVGLTYCYTDIKRKSHEQGLNAKKYTWSISHHIMPLGVNALRNKQTNTQAYRCTNFKRNQVESS